MQEDVIQKILASMPDNLDGSDVVDIIVNMVECYDMREDWVTIAVCVGHILNTITAVEQEKEGATHH